MSSTFLPALWPFISPLEECIFKSSFHVLVGLFALLLLSPYFLRRHKRERGRDFNSDRTDLDYSSSFLAVRLVDNEVELIGEGHCQRGGNWRCDQKLCSI